MGSEQYCLKWNNHWANLVRVFNSLRDSETFVDVTIACEGRHVKAHRLILSACSPYFKELLVSHPDKHPIIILKDVRYSELQNLIQFIYNGEVSVEQHDLASLLCTARELQIKGLADNCISNSLPPCAITPKAVTASGLRPLKESTNSSSILLSTKPNDQPTSFNIDANTTTTTTTTTTSTITLPTTCSYGSSFKPNCFIERPLYLDPTTGQSEIINTTVKGANPLENSLQTSIETSRDGSPLLKRRKMSRMSIEDSVASSSNISSLSDEVVKLKVPQEKDKGSSESLDLSQSSPLVSDEPVKEEADLKDDVSEEKENQKPEMEMLKEPKDKPPDTPVSISKVSPDEVDVEESMNPEVILEEDDSRVVTTNGTASPSLKMPSHPPTPSSSESTPKDVTKTPVTPTVSSQISFLQQALAMGYPQPLHFLQPNVLEQQQQQQQFQAKTTSGGQTLTPPGLVQSKNILNFVDLLKVMGAAMPPGSQASMIPNSNGNVTTASVNSSINNSTHGGFPATQNQSGSDSEKNPLTCHICARIMPSQQVLEEHVRIHEEEKPYKCEQCGQRYKYQSAFQRHQEQNHTAKLPGDKPYRCDVCGQCFKYHKSFTKHRANHDLLDTFMKTEPGEGGGSAIRALQESYLQRLLHPSFSPTDPLTPTIKEETKDSSEDETKGAKSPCLVSSTSLQGGSFGSENGDIKEEDDDIDIDEIVPDVPGDGEEDLEETSPGRFFFCVQCKLTFRDSKSFEGHCRLSPGCSLETLKEVAVGGDISVTSIPSSVSPSPQLSPQPSQSGSQPGTTSQASLPLSTNLVFSSPPAMLYTLVSGLPQSCFPSSSVTPTILNLSKLVNFGGVPNLSNAIRGLQQSLQNLENMQNLQNLENMQQNLQGLPNSLQGIQNFQASVASLQTLPSVVPNIQTFQNLQPVPSLQSFPSLQSIPAVQNIQQNAQQSVQSSPQTAQPVSKDEVANFTK
ncbi:Protein tramtrack, beta isoform [Armadillidium nasatum]|uniref:Protein tramtrack, beta isoform n=1 Tax=Armadillidium nasatum TaxID=96803 RepID=A0A5N5TG47_9CRUS|nr:Protein tramtrack, beta isoform [Armadillidium nasatum]